MFLLTVFRWNPYIYPPPPRICVDIPCFRIFTGTKVKRFTVISPQFSPIPVWQPFLNYHYVNSFTVSKNGEPGILYLLSKKGSFEDKNGLRWKLIPFRLLFDKTMTPLFTE